MATATARRREVVEGVTLNLTEHEARVLQGITMRIGGHPAGPRGAVDSIRRALNRAVGAARYRSGDGLMVLEDRLTLQGGGLYLGDATDADRHVVAYGGVCDTQ